MFKKIILLFFIIFISLFLVDFSFAYSIPVENVFSDIDNDYKYKNELQTLYDMGMISPDSEGRFNPRSLLNRDEFVGILTEVTCKECIQPDTVYELINEFENKQTFFDINKTNKYFYCIESAVNDEFVSGYHPGTICNDGTGKEFEKPFCPNNTIILEEAIAIILRASGILTNQEAEKMRIDIFNGVITEVLSSDVSPKNLDGSVYSFYPDIKKALEYEITEVDINGNVTISTLIEVVNGKIRPKQDISKEDFLRIAYLTLKTNSCVEKQEGNLALGINLLNTDDLSANVNTICENGISEPDGYIWRFYNDETGEEIKKYGKDIDASDYLKGGKWTINLRIIDNCGNTGEVNNTIGEDLCVFLNANPISGEGPLFVDLEGIVTCGKSPFTYSWNFGDGNEGYGKNIQNIYKKEGIYDVNLYVTDANGNTGKATALIQVIGINDGEIDSDKDGIIDIDDLCPLIYGEKLNKGCPILEEKCTVNTDCKDGYMCSNKNICLPKNIQNSCEYTGGDGIFGNVVCNSCPCNNSLDFTSTLRKCDIIFPAITSRDETTIFSKGDLFQIKK